MWTHSDHHFNSHAHVERDVITFPIILSNPISTHTLTWSVTDWKWHCRKRLCISTHTLTWSVTTMARDIRQYIGISTHTLTWSVTHPACCFPLRSVYFNSHAHVERDDQSLYLYIKKLYFNSHAHVERDVQSYERWRWDDDFNSHAHVERDRNDQIIVNVLLNFNSHAHVERDFSRSVAFLNFFISTHTLTWSVTFTFNVSPSFY